MAEGGNQQPPVYQFINAETINFFSENSQNIRISKSQIGEVHSLQGTSDLGQVAGGKLQADPAADSAADSSAIATNASGIAGESLTGTTSLFENVQSTEPPTGPGWVKLSETVFMNNMQLLKKGAAVYKGKQKFVGGWRDVAIKIIPYDEKDMNEVNHHLKLEDHINILRMFDAGEHHGGLTPQIYIVSELCPQTLKDFIDENKQPPFDFEQRFSYAKQIVAGIAFIHKKKILHRDIKLENLLLSPSKENIRVADFGLSKQLQEGHSIATATSRGLGTDGYRAPELLSENPKASFYSDTFSLGIVLATMFSNGHHPFGSDPLYWRTNIAKHKRPDLSHILRFKEPHSSKREQLLDLIKRCLKPNPRDRPNPDEMLRHPFFSFAPDHSSRNDERRGFLTRVVSFLAASKDSDHDKETDASAMSKPTISSTPRTTTSSNNVELNRDGDKYQPTLLSAVDKTTNNTENQARIKFLEGELKRPLKEIGYEKSAQYLEELRNLSGSDDLDTLLQLAECHLRLMSDKKDSSIAKVEHFISTSGSRSASDVRRMGYDLKQQGHYVQAMILYKISHDLRKKEKKSSPDEELEWIKYRVIDIKCAIIPLATGGTSRVIAKNYGLKYMTDMLSEVKKIKNATPDVKALNELECLVCITAINIRVGKVIELGEAGITMMKQQFEDKVSNYKRYGWLLHNLGIAYRNSGQYSKAELCYVTAIEVKERALDYKNEKERREDIERTKGSLEITCRLLGKQK